MNDDLDLFVEDHLAYGKGFIKTCKVLLVFVINAYRCRYCIDVQLTKRVQVDIYTRVLAN